MRRIAVLGSTGSIGRQALDVVRAHPDRFEVAALSASSNTGLLRSQIREFRPEYAALEDGAPEDLGETGAELLSGAGSSERLAELRVDTVLNGIVGFAGLATTVSALRSGNTVALANKESLVVAGEWVMGLAGEGRLVPVDSEHSAIFQCLLGRRGEEVSKLLLTASGGPFFDLSAEELRHAAPEDALKHPTWQMGRKVTIDSASMMNKGLEVIEAHHLFGVPYEDIKVVVHRQSVVHGGVTLADGSVILHAAAPDMRLPISYGLLYPERVDAGVGPVGFDGVTWTFAEPRDEVFRSLPLAVEAGRSGGAYPVALNAANEVAVEAFLDRRIQFPELATVTEEVLGRVPQFGVLESLEAVRSADRWAREEALAVVGRHEVHRGLVR
ncbi:MAG: 1-deoxy-D-xylulose-5-phosphate reductoisomerase [Rubrobacter sp.]|nr:1-deoxy-D-xylulose-5-phosphate reductoisomerase [Rubrobacter sp.]